MIENIADIQKKVYILSGLEDNELNNFKIELAVDEILAYCYRDDIPKGMVNIVADIIANDLKSDTDGKVIQSYSEGDMSISYAVNQNVQKYNGRLNKFKKIGCAE